MRTWSILPGCVIAAALASVCAGGPANSRSLSLTAARLHDPHVTATQLQLEIEQYPAGGSLRFSAGRIDVPVLALSGRIDWHCELTATHDAALACSGPVTITNADGTIQRADLAARVVNGHTELVLSRDDSRVRLVLPFGNGEPKTFALHQVPAAWLKGALAQAWTAGEVRTGLLNVDAQLHADGRVEADYDATDLTFNTNDGAASGTRMAVKGSLDWTRSANKDMHVIASVDFRGGTIALGEERVVLPDTPIALQVDGIARANGRWDVSRLAWNDPDALQFEASGVFEPASLAPLRRLDIELKEARFPLVKDRYAQGVLASRGIDDVTLRGELSGSMAIDARGLQRLALATPRMDFRDGAGRVSFSALSGAVDWAATGLRPPQRLAWKTVNIDEVELPASSSLWQSRNGALTLLGSLRTRVLGGQVKLEETVLRPQSSAQERVSTKFAFSGIGYDSKDGSLAAARLTAQGRMRFSGTLEQPRVRVEASLEGGEVLVDTIYVKLPATSVKTTLDATVSGALWHIQQFDWLDPGVLDLRASADIALADAHPLHGLQIDLHNVDLAPALARYAQTWAAAKGYGELAVKGTVAGALQWNGDGIQRLGFAAHSVDIRDGAGRFAVSGLDGGIHWDVKTDMRGSTLDWSTAELFRVPFGPLHAMFESQHGQIVLAKPIEVDVLGGQIHLEKLSMQPTSPRGDRYAGSFAIVGIDMTQLSSAFGWPRFGGNLSGGIPEIEWTGDTIELRGGLDLYVFDGHLGVSGMTLQRPFGVAPALGADIHFERFDLDRVTQAFSFGGMTGRLDGTIGNLRLLDWSPVAFDAWLRTNGGGRMSYNAINDLTAVAGGGGLSGGVQTMALKLFNTFGYRRLGIRCRLRDEVCAMSGLEPAPTANANNSVSGGYTIVAGSGIPRISIVGHHRRVDWPTLVRRLQEATQGEGPIVR